MKKLSCVLAALATIAVAAPTVASAQGFSFRVGSDRDYYYRDRDYYRSPRAEFYVHDRGLHRGWYTHDGGRTVIIKRHHSLKCRSCRKGCYAPPVHMIKLTETREITPYKWVHPDEER